MKGMREIQSAIDQLSPVERLELRKWMELGDVVKKSESDPRLKDLELRIGYARAGGKFSREEMNAR